MKEYYRSPAANTSNWGANSDVAESVLYFKYAYSQSKHGKMYLSLFRQIDDQTKTMAAKTVWNNKC
jgi:hypothetical protein